MGWGGGGCIWASIPFPFDEGFFSFFGKGEADMSMTSVVLSGFSLCLSQHCVIFNLLIVKLVFRVQLLDSCVQFRVHLFGGIFLISLVPQ